MAESRKRKTPTYKSPLRNEKRAKHAYDGATISAVIADEKLGNEPSRPELQEPESTSRRDRAAKPTAIKKIGSNCARKTEHTNMLNKYTEYTYFFDPHILFTSILRSDITQKVHLGFGEFRSRSSSWGH